jgi:hypothetical protein
MPEIPESIWKRPWRGSAGIFAWFALMFLGGFLILCGLGSFTAWQSGWDLISFAFVVSISLATLVVGGWLVSRWLASWHHVRLLIFGVACVATLVALAYAEENWRGWHDWQAYRRMLAAKGEKLDLAALAPPPVPDDKNFALTPLFKDAFDYTQGPNGTVWRDTNALARLEAISADLRPRSGTNELALGTLEQGTFADIPACAAFYRGNTNYPQAGPNATAPQVILTALDKFAPDLDELRQAAATRPLSRFPIHYDYEPTWGILLPHLARIKGLTRLTQVRATAELAAGDPAAAFADLKLGLRLSESIHEEPILIDHLVRLATLGSCLQTVREGLVRHEWNQPQLAELESDLGALDLLAEYRYAMQGERACAIDGLNFLRQQGFRSNPLDFVDTGAGQSDYGPLFCLMPGGWYYQNMLTIARMHERFTLAAVDASAHRVFPEVSRKGQQTFEQLSMGPYTVFARALLPALSKAVLKSARMQTLVDAGRVACALEAYRLANGSLPEQLQVLCPRFIAAIPNDVIDGKPLRYHLQPDAGYVLYSIGWNQIDDGGKTVANQKHPKELELAQGDWTWTMSGGTTGFHTTRTATH